MFLSFYKIYSVILSACGVCINVSIGTAYVYDGCLMPRLIGVLFLKGANEKIVLIFFFVKSEKEGIFASEFKIQNCHF